MDFCDVCGGDNSTCADCEGDTETCGEFLLGIICFVHVMVLRKSFVKL